MSQKKRRTPDCFANLETVFPMGKDGLRHTPDVCLACHHKTECLRMAIQEGGGLKVREEQIDRAYSSGMIGFFERWSRKKAINRQKKSG
ncbi:MAG: hypothetical protein V2J65_06060 [Desulfobacteraceae bacterium]|nr:hypothetical protein [Desulfobacteraceae bacterium]